MKNKNNESKNGSGLDIPYKPNLNLNDRETFIVTGATEFKEFYFNDEVKLDVLQAGMIKYALQNHWRLQAWAFFANHYHFIAQYHGDSSPSETENENTLHSLVEDVHSKSSEWLKSQNPALEHKKIWFKFWPYRLTYPNSYIARLKYIHENPVKHGEVTDARKYKWCSADWFHSNASQSQVEKLNSFRTEKLKIFDDFEPKEGVATT